MAEAVWLGTAENVKQVATNTVVDGSPAAGEGWTFVVTDEGGSSITVGYTVVTSDTQTLVAAGMASAVNNHTNPAVRRITATSSTNTLTLTATTAGQPFTVGTFADSAASGAWGGAVAVTANSGSNDYNTVSNWTTGAVPTASDNVTIPAGTSAILYGLNQSSVSINAFQVKAGYTGQIGGTDDAYFQVTLDAASTFEFAGTGKAWINVAASNITPVFNNTAAGSESDPGFHFKGTACVNIYINRGNVGIGMDNDDATTEVDIVFVGWINDPANDSRVTIGEDVTDLAGSGDPDVYLYGGQCDAWCDVTNLLVEENGRYLQRKGKYAVATCRGEIQLNNIDTGKTYGTTFLGPNARLLNERSTTLKTLGIVTASDGCTISDPRALVTWNTSSMDFASQEMKDCTFNFGANRIIKVSAS